MYYLGLSPSSNKIQDIITKFKVDEYEIPYYVAERYLIWYNMRTFFYVLNYGLTLLGLVATLLTVFYAAKDHNTIESSKRDKNIIFLSLLSTCFTVANIFINAGSLANMSQHAWRSLDTCIITVVMNNTTSSEEKNNIIADKIVEIENYIETYEH